MCCNKCKTRTISFGHSGSVVDHNHIFVCLLCRTATSRSNELNNPLISTTRHVRKWRTFQPFLRHLQISLPACWLVFVLILDQCDRPNQTVDVSMTSFNLNHNPFFFLNLLELVSSYTMATPELPLLGISLLALDVWKEAFPRWLAAVQIVACLDTTA